VIRGTRPGFWARSEGVAADSLEQDDSSSSPGEEPDDSTRSYGRILAIVLVLSAVALVVIRLGASLIGLQVFLGLDLLYLFAPWSSLPGNHPVTSSIYISDQLDGTIPAFHEVAQRLLHGDVASWSSLTGGGSPLLATPDYALISPGRWVYLFLPIWLAPGWSKLLEMAFAAIFTYLLVRRLRGSKVAAGVAGFIYPMTGFMIAWTNWPHVAVGSAIPMLFWAIERFVQERRVRAAIPIALAVALLLFGGFPAVAGQTLYLAGGYALVRLISRHRADIRQLLRDGFIVAAGVCLGFGLAAVQLLPFANGLLADVDLSYREGGFFVHDSLVSMLSTVFPMSMAGNHLSSGASPMDLSTYVGATVLLLGVLGAFYALTGRIRGSAGVYFVGMIVFIVGLLWFQGTWSNWMNHLPVFHGNPINRLRSQLGLPVAVLAAAGFDLLRGTSLSRGWARVPGSRLRWLTALVAVVMCGLVLAVGNKIADGPYNGLSDNKWPDVLIAGVPLVVIAILLLIGIRVRVARMLAMIAVIASVSLQAIAASGFYWPTAARSEFYPTTDGIRYLQQNLGHDRIATLGYAIRPNITAYFGLRSLNGHIFFPKPMKKVILGIDPGAFPGATYSIFWPWNVDAVTSPGLGRMGVRYAVGEANTVVPGQLNTLVPLYGAADPLPAESSTKPLSAGVAIRQTIRGGDLRGVNIPLTAASPTQITVALKRFDGTTIARNARGVAAGTTTVPVPLAADLAGGASAADSSKPITVEISSSAPGAAITTDAAGRVRLQAVRPDPKTSRIRLAYAGDNLVVWERLDYLPRIHWASGATAISNDGARLAAVTKSPLDLHGVVLADEPPAGFVSTEVQPRQVKVEEDSGDTIRVHVNTNHAGFVVVSDNIQKDFKASVDGRSAQIADADYAGGAVFVEAGSHEVVLHYDPAGRLTGARLTALSAVVLTLMALPPLWWGRIRRLAKRRTQA
jgi:Bacterial membrane protein YfhO